MHWPLSRQSQRLSYSLASVTQYVPSLGEAFGGMRRVEELLRYRPRVCDTGVRPPLRFAREVRFEGVAFGYSRDQPNLQELNTSIPQGKYIAVVTPVPPDANTLPRPPL